MGFALYIKALPEECRGLRWGWYGVRALAPVYKGGTLSVFSALYIQGRTSAGPSLSVLENQRGGPTSNPPNPFRVTPL